MKKKQLGRIRLLIADPQPLVRVGLAALIRLQADMRVVAEAQSSSEAVDLFVRHRPDVTLMDLHIALRDNVQSIVAIRKADPDARIICLSAFDGDGGVLRTLRAGAAGCMRKDASREELLKSIRTVHNGEGWIPRALMGELLNRFNRPELTSRELEVMEFVALGKRNKEIAGLLRMVEGTVKVHVNHILAKLNVRSRTEAVAKAFKQGIVQLPEE